MSTNPTETTTDPTGEDPQQGADTPPSKADTPILPEPQEEPQEPQEPSEVPTDAEMSAALKKARQEAAERRVAAREAAEEAEALRAELETAQQRLTIAQDVYLTQALYRTDVSTEAFRAAGYTAEGILTEDGKLDAEALATAVTDVGQRFGRVRRIGYVPSQGTGDPRPDLSDETTWADVLKKD